MLKHSRSLFLALAVALAATAAFASPAVLTLTPHDAVPVVGYTVPPTRDATPAAHNESTVMTATMRAKLKINRIERHSATSESLHFNAVCAKAYPADGSDEDNTFAKFSPSATLAIQITNPALVGQFNPGETYYVDFTPVDNEPPLTPFLG